ncbi:hypothetical protein IAT38_002673 [Cryptococcus sp. DSM 104549]
MFLPLPSFSTVTVSLITIFLLSFIFRLHLLPLLLRSLTQFRVTSVSPLSARGIEWRAKREEGDVIPTLRIERAKWTWGGTKGDVVGLVVLRVEGVSLRFKKGSFEKTEKKMDVVPQRKSSGRFSVWKAAFTSWLLQILIHHYPTIARIFSIQLVNCRVIFDDLDGFELTWAECGFGVRVNFQGEADGASTSPLSCSHPATAFRREHPLCMLSPVMSRDDSDFSPTLSPTMSPTSLSPPNSPIAHSSFTYPPSPSLSDLTSNPSPSKLLPPPAPNTAQTQAQPRRIYSSFSTARRRASVFQSRMSSTASKVWTRATGRMHGSVSFNAYIDTIRCIEPHARGASASAGVGAQGHAPLSAKSSTTFYHHACDFDPLPSPSPAPSPAASRPSSRMLFSRSPAPPSSGSGSTPALQPENGVCTLLALEGQSKISFGLGFGPKKGLLGEDTLSTVVELGRMKTSVEALERLQKLFVGVKKEREERKRREKERRKKEGGEGEEEEREEEGEKVEPVGAKAKEQWSEHATPRIILRAVESVRVSFSRIILLHHLTPAPTHTPSPASSTSRTHSRSSSASFASSDPAPPPDNNHYIVSLELSELGCTLSAADSSNNDRARNAFGTNPSPESKVRGIAAELVWRSIELQCIAPGECANDRSQLFAVRQAEITGFSSWRPAGWSREELLFANDPNLALVVCQAKVASVDCAGDLQLLHELEAAWRATHPPKAAAAAPSPEPTGEEKPKPAGSAWLPPRMRMVFDIGDIMAVLADRLSEDTTTLTFALGGLHLGFFTSFSDIVARRRDRAAAKAAFREEEELQKRRAEDHDADYAMHPSMLPTALRRRSTVTQATLRDDLSISMRGDAQISVEPIRVNMTLQGHRVYELAEVGQIHGTVTGDVLGRCEVREDGSEAARLDWGSLSCGVDVGIQKGVDLDLWKGEVIEALVKMGETHQQRPCGSGAKAGGKGKVGGTLLDKLPSGISARLSLGKINMFIGVQDPNPDCPLGLVRGLWFQTVTTVEYAYYATPNQALPWRHVLTTPRRSKLRLPEDITTQSLAFAAQYRRAGGKAALVCVNNEDTIFQPVFNGENFVKHGGIRQKLVPRDPPKPPPGENFVGWGFQRSRMRKSVAQGEFANSVPPLELTGQNQAQRPFMRVRGSRLFVTTQQQTAESEVEFKVALRLEGTNIVSDLSHAYCNLLAGLAVKRIAKAWRREKKAGGEGEAAEGKPKSDNVSLDVTIPSVTAHLAFPLKEQMFSYASGLVVTKQPNKGPVVSGDQLLVYVPSPRMIGSWEELGRMKRFAVALSDPHLPLVISPHIESLRIRIPFSYQMNSLILNINVAIKASKLMYQNFSGKKAFSTVLRPRAEEPKKFPALSISIGYMSIEAKDDPVETSLNLIWRAGIVEQAKRNALEDNFAKKLMLLSEQGADADEPEEPKMSGGKRVPALTKKATVAPERARWALDMLVSQSWVRRIRAAKHEQARREGIALQPMHGSGTDIKLPIDIASSSKTAPLFRAAFNELRLTLEDPGMSRADIIDYMGKVSSPFDKDAQFTLMIPAKMKCEMAAAMLSLRDYPLPLIRVQRVEPGETRPAFHMDMTLIIAEEIASDDSIAWVPVETIPAGCGDPDAKPFVVRVAKTISPVKMYAEPRFKIASKKTTEFTWGNSYQPAIQDMMKVFESLSHPPRDPSPKVGFWDKMRLVFHWKPTVDFAGPCHLHLKGSFDPYSVSGLGAGFALAWRGNTQLLINQPNVDREVIQILADELVVAIPDLTALHDAAATGNSRGHRHDHDAHDHSQEHSNEGKPDESDQALIERRYTKPCARFVNGVRVGFGFRFERTCRPWTCKHDCGNTENLMHRQCHEFNFIQHQAVVLRSKEAVKRDEERLGRRVDSYEGFRSDFIHFSVSLVAPHGENPDDRRMWQERPDKVNSLHFAPKASHHFLSWWRLFGHQMSLPIRQGKLFPDSPPPSKKFGRSLGTIKYRFDLKPVYISHVYSQVSKDHPGTGRSESLGIKARFGRFRADAHQRAQEKIERHEKLGRSTVVVHKPFYAADILADDIKVKGIHARFEEGSNDDGEASDDDFPRTSHLPPDLKHWYNYLDYIDVDRKPIDRDPRIELVDFGDCPHFFYSKRVKARASTSHDDDSTVQANSDSSLLGVESSKFGHELTHHCYLGLAEGVREVQRDIAQKRINELWARLDSYPPVEQGEDQTERFITKQRIDTLLNYIRELGQETRHISDETLEHTHQGGKPGGERPSDATFEDTIHVHCPRLFFTNKSRNIGYKYLYSMADRKKEEYFTSYASLRNILESFKQRMERRQPDISDETRDQPVAQQMLTELVDWLTGKDKGRDKMPPDTKAGPDAMTHFRRVDNISEDSSAPYHGLPEVCSVKPKYHVLVFKPQIALRSESEANAIVLLAVEEVSFKQFKVVDTKALDRVQGFYPTAEALKRERTQTGMIRGLDFLPLEIFLDVKSEATDYDRVLRKSDIGVSLDKFNHIRMPQGLEWPENAKNEYGDPITHLSIHQDLTSVVTPMLTVEATSKNYEALYAVATDLIAYQDPEHKRRSEAVDDFTRQFDAADRDVGRLIADVNGLQSQMRNLLELQHGYETNFDRLDNAGKEELFKIRSELQTGYENMYTVNALIRSTLAKDDARTAMKTATRMDVKIGGVAWHMLRESRMEMMAKVHVTGVLLSLMTNKNGSVDSAMVMGDLLALNGSPDPLYLEIIMRDDVKKRSIKPFAAIFWSTVPAIGGIPIFPIVNIEFVNIKFRLEERVGLEVMDYIFTDRTKRRQTSGTGAKGTGNGNANGHANGNITPTSSVFRHGKQATSTDDDVNKRATASTTDLAIAKNRSQVSLVSYAEDTTDLASMKRNEDTREMRLRASKNKMFGQVRLQGMGFLLSYKSDDTRKHGTFSMPDCVDFKFKTPEMVYVSKVWGIEDIFEHIKRDIKSSAWSQSGDIISQIFKKTSLFRSKERLKHAAAVGSEVAHKKGSGSSYSQAPIPISPSHLRNAIDNMRESPEPDEELINTLSRALSREAGSSSSIDKVRSRSTNREQLPSAAGYTGVVISPEQTHGSGSGASSQGLSHSVSNGHASIGRSSIGHSSHGRRQSVDEEDEEDEKPGKKIRGLLGKLKPKHHGQKEKEKESAKSGDELREERR